MKGIVGRLVFEAAIAVGAALYLREAAKLPFGSAGMPGAGFMPVLVGSSLLALCILLIAKELLFRKPVVSESSVDLWEEGDSQDEGIPKKVIFLGLAFFIYAFFFSTIGFVCSTIILLWITLLLYQFKNWWVSLVIAIILTGIGYAVFALVLDVQFPHGILY